LRPGRLYGVLSWGAAAAVTAVLVASWVDLYALHAASIEPGLIRQIDRKTIVPKFIVEVIGFSAVGIAILGVAIKTWRRSAPILLQETIEVLRTPAGAGPGSGEGAPRGRVGRAFAAAAREIAGGGMRECEDAQQWVGHFLTMWGFVGLFVTTSLDAVVNRAADPLPLLHPVRLLGNVTGIMFVAGLTLALARRALLSRARSTSKLGDWTFLISLWGAGATGFVVQWYADNAAARGTSWSYLIHLAFIGLILAAAPWTKFIHAVWRPSWVLYRQLTADGDR
jgi:hypothetical protein